MASSVNSPSDVIALALAKIGYKGQFGSLFEGSLAARKALDIYAQTRDEVLRSRDWVFSEKIAAATIASGATTPPQWTYVYAYPSDCIRLRSMFNATTLAGNRNNPLPVLYTAGTDPAAGKVIWTNIASPTLVYTAQVDDMTQWEPLFTATLVAVLAKVLAASLADMNAVKMATEDAKDTASLAESITE